MVTGEEITEGEEATEENIVADTDKNFRLIGTGPYAFKDYKKVNIYY